MTIDVGRVGIWTAALEGQPAARVREAAQELEALGFPALWINETTGRDPFVLATLLLSAKSTMRVATGIAERVRARRGHDGGLPEVALRSVPEPVSARPRRQQPGSRRACTQALLRQAALVP